MLSFGLFIGKQIFLPGVVSSLDRNLMNRFELHFLRGKQVGLTSKAHEFHKLLQGLVVELTMSWLMRLMASLLRK